MPTLVATPRPRGPVVVSMPEVQRAPGAARQASQSRRLGNLYELLPDVLTREKTPQRLRRPLESLHDVDLGSNLPGRSPARELGDCFPKAGGEGQDQEAAHGRAGEDEVQI